MFDTVASFALASALAASGTLTVAYPSGRSKGNYHNSTGRHRLIVRGSTSYTAPKHFTLTFNANASNITLTWGAGMPTLAAGTVLTLQLERVGADDGRPNDPANAAKMADARAWIVDLGSPNVADADGVSVSQSVGAAANFTITGALASGGVATFDVPRNVVAAWTTTSVLTITGKDEYDNTIVEVSASGTSHTGKKAFKKVTSVSSSASITSATVGTGTVLGLPMFLPSVGNVVAEYQDGAILAGSNQPVKLPFYLDQVSLLGGTTHAAELISPCDGVIARLTTVVRNAVTTGDSITVAIATTAVDGLACAIADAATKGTTATDTPTAGHATTFVAKGDRIQIIPGNTFATAGGVDGVLEITPTGGNGTLVAGAAAAKQSGTTGDVRGTYDPANVPDGSIGYQLLVIVPTPDYKGDDQYAG